MTRLVICGIRGRMGQALAQLASAADDVVVTAGMGRTAAADDEASTLGCRRLVSVADAATVLDDADVIIDFSNAHATGELLRHAGAALARKALVVGTTGLDDETNRALDDRAADVAILTSANFSVGVNLLLALSEQVAAVLDAARYDAEIVEAHHAAKVDAPSGTALALAGAVAAGRRTTLERTLRAGRSGATGARAQGEIGVHAVRGGSVIGEHHVLFLGSHERIELVHRASDRTLFAEGALHAARWIAGRPPGRYHMRDVLGIGDRADVSSR